MPKAAFSYDKFSPDTSDAARGNASPDAPRQAESSYNGVTRPGVLGHVLTGVRLSIGILWIVLVPCAMLGVSAGLGYFILDPRD